ncbi:hypothetical protein [Lentibacillus salicampi]|uniref:Uncharacterized protein n=1 Tax=Lentibacillus salicampi TaxID=175306 RepID=A0A4Y9AES2_9BACI|nr:hypothetical protein [Lentibacillus salicampi]TFJ93842.1 hypothetical protein E4U82_05635 [Lentibacillus salicampi]
MVKFITANSKAENIRKRDFKNALSDMADQLRLMDQKITVAADNSIEQEFQSHQQELYHSIYTLNKLQQNPQLKRKELVHNRFIPDQADKRLS